MRLIPTEDGRNFRGITFANLSHAEGLKKLIVLLPDCLIHSGNRTNLDHKFSAKDSDYNRQIIHHPVAR